jgi:hypothetical protein
MTLSRKIDVALDGPDAGTPPCDLVLEDGGHRLAVHLTASGPVGLAFDSLELSATPREGAGAGWSPAALKAWGERIAARVSYLMEPLVVLEQDALAGEVAIRSHAPTARGDLRAFYEIRIAPGGTLHLARLGFDEASRRRRPVDCMMTREVLERLVDDIVASIP